VTVNKVYRGVAQPGSAPEWGSANSLQALSKTLIINFIASRRQGLSPRTLEFYYDRLIRASSIIGFHIKAHHINYFFDGLHCSNGNKHAYWRALTVFYHWLYSPRSGYGLNPPDNPILFVDSPKRSKRIMPSLTEEQVEYITSKIDSLRDQCFVRLLFDSGMRLTEITSIQPDYIDWNTYTITIIGKGNKQRKAPFTRRTGELLLLYLSNNGFKDNVWGIGKRGIQTILKKLSLDTGIKFSCHAFRRGFACNLHRKGLSTLDIMYLGGWSDLSMVLRYTHSITFDDCLKHYQKVVSI
jgi:integrase